jgi:hypothetical protein
MKNLTYLLLIFLFSCNSKNNETIAFLDKGIVDCNEIIYRKIEVYKSYFEAAMQEDLSAKRTEKWKLKVDKVEMQLKEINYYIEKNREELQTDDSTKIYKQTTSKFKDELFPEIKVLETQILNIGLDSIFLRKIVDENFDFSVLHKGSLNIQKLNLILNKINNLIYFTYTEIFNKIYITHFRANKFEVLVQTESNYIKKGEMFEAKILFVITDTLYLKEMVLDGKDTLKLVNGKAFYSLKTDSIGDFEWKSEVEITTPLDIKRIYPVSVRYKVIEN